VLKTQICVTPPQCVKRVAKRAPVTQIVTRCYTNAMVKNEAKFSPVQKYYAHDILVGAFESFAYEIQIQTSIYGHDCQST